MFDQDTINDVADRLAASLVTKWGGDLALAILQAAIESVKDSNDL